MKNVNRNALFLNEENMKIDRFEKQPGNAKQQFQQMITFSEILERV